MTPWNSSRERLNRLTMVVFDTKSLEGGPPRSTAGSTVTRNPQLLLVLPDSMHGSVDQSVLKGWIRCLCSGSRSRLIVRSEDCGAYAALSQTCDHPASDWRNRGTEAAVPRLVFAVGERRRKAGYLLRHFSHGPCARTTTRILFECGSPGVFLRPSGRRPRHSNGDGSGAEVASVAGRLRAESGSDRREQRFRAFWRILNCSTPCSTRASNGKIWAAWWISLHRAVRPRNGPPFPRRNLPRVKRIARSLRSAAVPTPRERMCADP